MKWKEGKSWVYSITYDEGCADLLKYVLPLHRKYGIAGHICLVASQIGVRRHVGSSSYNDMMILSKAEIRMLCKEGWGVSCHGMNHVMINDENIEEELYKSRLLLEKTLEMPIKIFCLPGDNSHHEIVKTHAEDAGYDAVLTIFDRINLLKSDLLAIGRCPLHTEYPPPFYSRYDPYKRIHQAIDHNGWIIDYCHCPMPGKPIHPAKDCTTEELEERFSTILKIGGNDVWLAEPTEAVEYILSKKAER
jgi:peptidoglycan/xylan/chitin deacetylase (PgdA/CDA1 family)